MPPEGAFPPSIAAQLNYLLTNSPFPIKVDQVWSGTSNQRYLDRIALIVPYCLDHLKWDILYNSEYPLSAPDVIFGPEDENFHPFSSESSEASKGPKTSTNSLGSWTGMDPSQLLNLILELRNEYMNYQTKCAGEIDDDRLKFEISTILSKEGIEIHISPGVEKPEEVKFAVPLSEVNINRMVRGCSWKHQQKIYLQVVYPVGKQYASAPAAPRLKLVSSPELKAIFSVDDVKLPPWLDGMCLAEYLPNIEESIERQVLEAVTLIDARRRFIEALSLTFGRPIEADPVFCRKATFLAASGSFTFLVHFNVTTQFPKQQPSLMLQSSQHFNSQGPIKSALIMDYPWSPRWEVSEMAERLWDFMTDEALNFKKYCNEALNLNNTAVL